MKTFQEIAEILSKSNYLNCKIVDKTINDIKFLPLGSIFLNRIKTEWQQNKGHINTYLIPNNTENKEDGGSFSDPLAYLKSVKFHNNFLHIKNNFQKEIPLAIKEKLNVFTSKHLSTVDVKDLQVIKDHGTLLSCTYFINEQLANKYFYKIQRERKIWWMKLSSNPGRYFLTNLKSNTIGNNYKIHSIKIKSKFHANDYNLELENIHVIPLKALKLEKQNDFYLKDVRLSKRVIPAVVRTEMYLDTAAIGLLLDAVEDTRRQNKMSINRKIAPYQCCIFCYSEDEKNLSELQELAAYLTHLMRKSGIAVLNLPKCYLTNESYLKKEIIQMDRIGVPFSIILEPTCLKDGLLKMRDRETTISETIHISDIPDYLLKIFNSE